jgi:hypothetical protein
MHPIWDIINGQAKKTMSSQGRSNKTLIRYPRAAAYATSINGEKNPIKNFVELLIYGNPVGLEQVKQ